LSARPSAELLRRLSRVQCVTVFTGAGMSVESGVPTFRGKEGIWSKFRPEELATMDAFLRNPKLVWEWYAHRRSIIADVQPNAGHRALVELEQMTKEFAVVTQNIDNLHRRAGSKTVIELHGNIERNYCLDCSRPHTGGEVVLEEGVPHCQRCGGRVRPDVVWFGEMLPEEEWEAAVRATTAAEVFLSVGTSGVVYPAASLPLMAKRSGAYLVEVNTEPTPMTASVDEYLEGRSGEILPQLVEALRLKAGRRS